MGTTPYVDQVRRDVILPDGTGAFEVTTSIYDSGDLPTKNLFVLKIVDAENPKVDVLARIATPQDVRRTVGGFYVRVDEASMVRLSGDTFARVASLADLGSMDQDRTEAVRKGRTEYLVATVSSVYTNSVTADAAYRQFLARLSDLVNNWRTFRTAFVTTPSQRYSLPVAGVSVQEERAASYLTSVTRRKTAEAALGVAQAAYDTCRVSHETEKAIHALLLEDVAFLERAKSRVQALTETGSTNARDYVLGLNTYAGDAGTYEALLTRKNASLTDYAARVRAADAACAASLTERDSAAAELSRALTDERRALADVRAVCPTYTPTE